MEECSKQFVDTEYFKNVYLEKKLEHIIAIFNRSWDDICIKAIRETESKTDRVFIIKRMRTIVHLPSQKRYLNILNIFSDDIEDEYVQQIILSWGLVKYMKPK